MPDPIGIIHSVLQNVRTIGNYFWRPLASQHIATMEISPKYSEDAPDIRTSVAILNSFFVNNHSKHPIGKFASFSAVNTYNGKSIVHIGLTTAAFSDDGERGLLELLEAEQENFTHR